MDPDATLQELLRLADEPKWLNGWPGDWAKAMYTIEALHDRLDRYGELVAALDGWLSNGGFPPKTWRGENK